MSQRISFTRVAPPTTTTHSPAVLSDPIILPHPSNDHVFIGESFFVVAKTQVLLSFSFFKFKFSLNFSKAWYMANSTCPHVPRRNRQHTAEQLQQQNQHYFCLMNKNKRIRHHTQESRYTTTPANTHTYNTCMGQIFQGVLLLLLKVNAICHIIPG